MVTPDATRKVLDACPDHEWRLLIALARYGGLRTPSEVLSLTWPDILWDQDRFRVRSPKTERQGKPERLVPLFPELRPYLDEAFELAEPGAPVIASFEPGERWAWCNVDQAEVDVPEEAEPYLR